MEIASSPWREIVAVSGVGVSLKEKGADRPPATSPPGAEPTSWWGGGRGGGRSQPARTSPAGRGPFPVGVGDLKGEGHFGLAVANYGSANVSVLLGNGDGGFQTARNFPAGSEPYFVAVGDFDGD